MIALVLRLAGLLFSNRLTTGLSCAALIIGGAYTWHRIDRGSAVRTAVVQFVAGAELDAAKAQIAEANRRAAVAKVAAKQLQERMQVAEGEALRREREIEAYETQNPVNPAGLVDDPVFDLLRAN